MSLLLLVGQGVPAQAQVAGAQAQRVHNFDARVDHNRTYATAPWPAQRQAIQGLRDLAPGLAVTYDRTTGVTRTLLRRGGHLTAERSSAEALSVARDFITANYAQLGLSADDLADYEVSDQVYSSISGVTHIYLRQTYLGFPVYNGQLQINVAADGRILSVNNTCMPDIAGAAAPEIPALSAAEAVAAVADHLEIQLDRPPEFISAELSPAGITRVRGGGLSLSNIEARLMWLPIQAGDARLVWNFQIATIDDGQVYDLTVDAASGQVWTRFDWVAQDSYRVFPAPVESPIHAVAPPPADGREIVFDPADPLASPFGWHDVDGLPGAEFTTHRGNNVHAYDDIDNTNSGICTSTPSPPAFEPDCGPLLDCDFPVDLALDPLQYTSGAVTNLFYWNNLIHDVQYRYGFDEAAGNFQENNYGAGGLAGDYLLAETQDGSDFNNADICVPPDGQRPRMQMFLWDLIAPSRDGDFDNGIIVHEYGHGISIRLVGGPSNASCLGNAQQPGEGLSDWWALVYTARPADLGTDGRGIGAYVLGEAPSGLGFRTQRYSTDPTINTHTYASIAGKSVPHGVGEVWAQAAWEVYWALVDAHGFDSNLHNALGGFGNQRAMLYVNEGLKNTVCLPTFTDVRDGILLAAASPPFNGQDVCLLWEGFAAFGLGEDAVSGGPNGLAPTNGFAVPAICLGGSTVSLAASDPTATETGPTSGAFTVTRVGDTSAALTIFYAAGGTATPVDDYAALGGSVAMAAGQASATIAVVPIDDILIEGNETVVVTLAVNAAYSIGAPAAATVTIVDGSQPPAPPPPTPPNFTLKTFELAGGVLSVEIRDAEAGAPVTIDGIGRGGTDGRGRYKSDISGFSSITCEVTVQVGAASTQAIPTGCVPTATAPPPPPNLPPVAAAAATPTSGEAPLSVVFSSAGSSDPEGGILTFSWTFGDGAGSTAANPTHSYAAGDFTAVLTVTDTTGATATASLAIAATAPPPPPPGLNLPPVAAAGATPSSGEAPLTVDLSSVGSSDPEEGILTFAWDFGDGAGSTEPHPTHTYAAGDFTAVLTVTDAAGATANASVAIAATAPPPSPSPPTFTLKTFELAGSVLSVEIRDADAGAPVTIDGVGRGATDDRGRYKNDLAGFSSPSCVVTVQIGASSTQATPAGCVPALSGFESESAGGA